MTEEQLELLMSWVRAYVAARLSGDSSDGGLIEAIREGEAETELRAAFKVKDDD